MWYLLRHMQYAQRGCTIDKKQIQLYSTDNELTFDLLSISFTCMILLSLGLISWALSFHGS